MITKKHVLVAIFYFYCSSLTAQSKSLFGTADYIHALKQSTDIMVNDVTSPIAAARYYAYITLAASEVFTAFKPSHPELSKSIRDCNRLVMHDSLLKHSNPSLTAMLCIYKSSSRLLPSGYLMNQRVDSIIRLALKKLPAATVNNSLQTADSVVAQIIKYASADGFRKLSGMKRYTPTSGDEYWQPTPPAYMSALEPYWNTLRPFTLDSASQFKPKAPEPYNRDTSSKYYAMLKEVYDEGKKRDKNKQEIAMFWDCNPFALQQMGHLEFGLKKISPGGHWMGITGIACLKAKRNFQETAYIHAVTAITLADAFISCWDEKYRSNRIRPETGIKRLIDPLWQPLLQTPPFPEYPSGHSVVSSAAATVLTEIFGEKFAYTDDTENEFGLAPRRFNSFRHAANEASISRLYGGIHYRDAIEQGIKEGNAVGEWVLSKISGDMQVPPLSHPGQGAYIKSEFIYPLNNPPVPQAHASTIVETPSGLVTAFFAGTHEGHPDVGIWISRNINGKWTGPQEIINGKINDTLRYPCWNPVLFLAENGSLMLYYKVGPGPREWWGMLMTSADNGKTWSKPHRLGNDEKIGNILGPVKNKPVRLKNGTIINPSSIELMKDDPDWRVYFEVSNDNGKSWKIIGPINDGVEFDAIQPSILEYGDGRIQAVCRTRQDVIAQSWSSDHGKTWSKMTALHLPNPNSGTDAVTLKDGRQLLIYNHTTQNGPQPNNRNMLNLALSGDGIHWKPVMTLENKPIQDGYAYPAIIESADGKVHITYTYNRRGVKYVVVDPEKLR